MSKCILDRFENTVSRFPDHIAAADESRKLTFTQLKHLSRGIAELICKDDAPVGVMAHRDVFTVAMFFGALYGGRCYVPIDPEMPLEKISKIIKNAGISLVISCRPEEAETVEAAGAAFLAVDPAELLRAPALNQSIRAEAPHGLLYLIYTSGSTGTPKGVAKSQEAMESFVDAYLREFSFDENTVIGNQTPFFFDASAKDIYVMAACGASLEIIPTALFSFPFRLIEYMNERKISFISWVPSALSIVTALHTFSEIKPKYLKRVCFVGEVFPAKHLNQWIAALPDVEFVNLYGSSEICGISCFYRVEGAVDPTLPVPIGAALSNCDVRLVENGKAVSASDVPGEIFVASPALAEGYYGDAEKTQRSFTHTDLGDGTKRYYRTGDIARYNSRGQLVFVARGDLQIKHMGHRIELGEIETAALAIQGVQKCCCLYDDKKKKIVLYIQAEAGASITDAEIRRALKTKLSDYMMPHKLIYLEKLPLNANGKTDRAALSPEMR